MGDGWIHAASVKFGLRSAVNQCEIDCLMCANPSGTGAVLLDCPASLGPGVPQRPLQLLRLPLPAEPTASANRPCSGERVCNPAGLSAKRRSLLLLIDRTEGLQSRVEPEHCGAKGRKSQAGDASVTEPLTFHSDLLCKSETLSAKDCAAFNSHRFTLSGLVGFFFFCPPFFIMDCFKWMCVLCLWWP